MKKFNLIEMLQGCSKRNGTTFRQSNPDGEPTVNRQSRLMSYRGNLKNLAMLFAVLMLSIANIGTAWGADFTPAEIIASGGTSRSNIKVSASSVSTESKNICSGTKQDAATISSAANATWSDKYIEIQATSGTISTLSLKARGNTDGAGAMILVFWTGDAGATYTEYSTSHNYIDRSGSNCDGSVSIDVPANTKTVRVYKGIKVKDGAFDGSTGCTTVSAGGTICIFGISATASAPSNSPDTPGATGTVTFTSWTSLSTGKCYWKDGIKCFQYSSGGLNADAVLNFTSKVDFGYMSPTAGSGWGSYNMSGLVTYACFALGVSITTPSVVEVVVDNNQSNDLTLARLFIKKDDVSYGTDYGSGNYTSGTDIKSRATITRVTDNTGRYKISIPVSASDLATTSPYIIKFYSNSWTNPIGFVFESVTVKPVYTVTYNANGKDGGGAAPTDGSSPYVSGSNVTVLGNTNSMTKTDCVFNGWNTRSDGTGTHYDVGAVISSISENITLYAEWVHFAESIDIEHFICEESPDASKKGAFLSTNNYNATAFNNTGYECNTSSGKEGFKGLKMKDSGFTLTFYVPADQKVTFGFGRISSNSTNPNFTIKKNGTTQSLPDLTLDSDASYKQEVICTTSEISKFELKTTNGSTTTLMYISIDDPCTDPGAATGLSRTSATGTTMTLGWTAGSNASSYKVSLFTDADCTVEASSTEGNDYAVNTNSVTYTGLSLNSTYYFKVQSVGDGSSYCEDGPWSSASGAVKTGACNDYSFHYGTENADDWTTTCFTQVGATSEWEVTDFTIPSKPNWYVGKYGFFYNDGMNYENAKSHTDAWSDLFFAASQGNGSGTRPKVGAATGATGRIRIYNNSSWNNLFASFEPDGYKLKFGSSTYDTFEADGSVDHCYWSSSLYTYSSSNAGDLVSVGIIDANNDFVSTNNTEGMKHIFLNTGGTDYWSKDNITNFGLWNETGKSWTCLMTKVPGEDYLYEGWVPSTCTQVIFARLKSSDLKWKNNDSDGSNTNVYDQTGTWTIPANTNMFTISEWSSGSWSAYSRTGKFRMWDNSTDKNWYVHFYPHNVLSYDGNGGTGSVASQSVKADADSKTVTVSANGFTRSGWEFTGWNTAEDGSGMAYEVGADFDLTSDQTLYAQWEKTIYLQSDLEWWYDADESSNPAWFSVYYWKSGQTGAWVTMEIAEECSDPAVYKATLPGNGFTNLIFVRKTATKTTGWDDVNNQSVDIDYPTTYNKFTIAGTDNGKVTGSWGTYSVPTFTISYNKGTNGTGTKDNESKTCGVDFTLPGGTFTYDGHSQDGWATSDGGTKAYNLSGSYTTNVAQTFYPHWKCNTPEISCSSGTVTITVPSGATVYYTTTTDGSEPADPTSSSSEYDPESKPTISEDTKIKAIAIQDGCTSSEIASEDLEYVNTYTVTYTTTESTSGSAPTDSNSPYTSGSTVTVLGNTGSLVKTGNVFLGWSDGSGNNYAPGETFTISSNTTLSPIWKDGTSATVTYTMAVGNKAWSASGSSNETTGIPNAGVTITTTNAGIDGGNGTGSKTAKLAIQATAQGATYESPTNYILYNFSVASGYAFTPSDITIQIANVGSKSANNIKYKAVLSDASSHSISTTYVCTTGDGTIETFHLYNEEGVAFDGNVSLKLWAWKINSSANGSSKADETGSAYRLGTPLTIAGVTESTCSTPADPDGLAVGSITSSGATFTITDDESPASYEIYYSTSSTAPTSGTAASATTTSKTKAVTGLNPSTTYYAWVRAVCNASYKSDWVALTGSSFETEVMSLPATLDKSNVTAVSDDTYWSDDNTYYDYGSEDAANTSRYQDWVVYVMPCTYEVSVVMNYTGTGGGTQWGLYLLDAEKNEVTSYESDPFWEVTNKTYDAKWDLSKISEGTYTLRVKNIFEWAQPKLKSLTLSASIYTATYDANGGTCGTESETVCGGSVTLPTPTRAGYACTGWYTATSGGTKRGDCGGSYTLTADETLHAQWAAMPTVSGLEIDYTNATATSIPLSWTIPGICDLKNFTDPLYLPTDNDQGTLKSTSSYTEGGDYVTAIGNSPKWGQYGVGFDIPTTNGLEWLSFDWKGSFYDPTNGNDVILCGVFCDDSHAYWQYESQITLNDDSKWSASGKLRPTREYWDGSYVTMASKDISQVAIYANAGHNSYDPVTFNVRNVRYHTAGMVDIDHVVLMRKEGSAATDTTDASATKLYSGTKSHFTDNTAVAGKEYYYTVFTVHASGAVSTGVSEHLTIYTITYDKGANGAGTIADGKKTGQIDFTLTGTRFTRDHYIQDGWSESDGGAKVYEMSGTYSTDDDITLYPHWVNLDLHQPGVYEKPESLGGYGRPLKLISSHDYEVYFMTQDTVDEANHGALYAGPKDTKISLGKEIFKEAAANTEIKGDGWMAFHMATSINDSKDEARIGSAASDSEFFIADGDNVNGAKDSRYAEILSGNYIRFRVSGYDQFSFYGGDYNASDQFIVKIDGITQSYTHNYSNNRNIFRFDISTGEHLIEITANGTGSHYCKLRAFSFRLPDVTRYTVSAESNNDSYGAVSASSVTNVRSGSTLYVSSNTFTVNGTTITATPESNTAEYSYAFNNWTIDSSPVTTTATISAVTTVTANFTQTTNSYSLSWSTDGDDLTGDYTSGTVAYGTSITEPNTPTKTGYTFDAWSPAFTGTMPAANTEYVAQWTINSHTLTWDFGGGSTSDDDYTTGSVAYGTTLDYPADNTMSKSGCDFAGWSTDASTMPDEDLTITAQWATKYTITYNAMGGSVDPTSETVSTATLPTPTHASGYTFLGWYTTDGTPITGTYHPIANITLYAKWHGDCAGGGGGDPTWYYYFTSTADATANSVTNATDIFTSMLTSDGTAGSNMSYSIGELTLSSAKWHYKGQTAVNTEFATMVIPSGYTMNKLQIAVNPGGSNLDIKVYNASSEEVANTGTITNSDGVVANINAELSAGTYTLKFTGRDCSRTYAIAVQLTPTSGTCYTVTYHGNNATSGFVDDPAQYAAGSSVSAKYNSAISGFERTGYEFVEWNTAANGSGDAYKPFARITSSIADDINLYAQWRIVIDANNTNFAGKDDPTQYRDVKVTKGATLTLTQNTAVRDIIVETGSTLNVSTNSGSPITLSTRSLSLVGGWGTVGEETKYDMPRVFINSASKITKTTKTINFDIAVDNRNFYPIAVPFPVTVSDVDYVNATLAYYSNYGTSGQYVIKTYNGQARANADMSNCWRVMRDGEKHYLTSPEEDSEVMVPGQGYILRALPASGYGDYAVIRFPMKNVDDEWTNGGEKGVIYPDTEDKDSKNAVSVVAYENESGDTKLSNKGWNILGVPYMTCFVSNEIESDETNAYIKGLLNITTGEYTEDGNVYVTVPKHDFSEYDQLNFSEAKLLPGWCFFVQMDKDATLTFDKAGERASAPFRATMYEQKPTVKTGIILSGAEASDKTTILVSDKYSATDYEINADLEKMFGENSYTLATYSLMGETRLAYNAMSNSDATNVIPIGYRAPADGEYTFAINPRYAENGAFEHVNLIDYETGFVTDLLVSSYSFATERTQNDERFALNVVKAPQTATDITVTGDGLQVAGPQKVIINDKLYIIVDGKMYDAKGVMVK